MMRRAGWLWRLRVWWNGRCDGKREIPSAQAKALGEAETRIVEEVNGLLASAAVCYTRAASMLWAQAHSLRRRRDQASERFEQMMKTAGRAPVTYLRHSVHVVLLFVLGAAELAFNTMAFTAFAETPIHGLVMATGIALVFPLLAFWTGVRLRQWPHDGTLWSQFRAVLGLACVLGVMGACLYGLQMLRTFFLQQSGVNVTTAAHLDLALFGLNVLVLLGAMAVSYLSYDEIPNFVETEREQRGLDHALVQREGRLAELYHGLRFEADALESVGRQLIGLYRRTNRHHRPLSGVESTPTYFDDDADKNHRPAFRNVETDVGQEEASVRRMGPVSADGETVEEMHPVARAQHGIVPGRATQGVSTPFRMARPR